MNLPGFPVNRPRRLRQSPALRRLVAETHLRASQLVLPLFARSGKRVRRPINAMPGVFQLSPDEVLREAIRAHTLGVPAVLAASRPAEPAIHWADSYAEGVAAAKKEGKPVLLDFSAAWCG